MHSQSIKTCNNILYSTFLFQNLFNSKLYLFFSAPLALQLIRSCVSIAALYHKSLYHNPIFFQVVLNKLFRLDQTFLYYYTCPSAEITGLVSALRSALVKCSVSVKIQNTEGTVLCQICTLDTNSYSQFKRST